MELSQLYYEMLMSMVDQEQNYLDTLVSNLNANLFSVLKSGQVRFFAIFLPGLT